MQRHLAGQQDGRRQVLQKLLLVGHPHVRQRPAHALSSIDKYHTGEPHATRVVSWRPDSALSALLGPVHAAEGPQELPIRETDRGAGKGFA